MKALSKKSSINDRDLDQLREDSTLNYGQQENQKFQSYQSKRSTINNNLDRDSQYAQQNNNNNNYKYDESDKNTFVTGLIENELPPHLQVQVQLDRYVDNIENQFEDVLNRHETDFLNAYKGHMVKVQKELIYLKKKANETAGKILNDDSVTNLQKHISWFKNEAQKLDVILESQKREIQKLKSRELNLNEDRKFLKEQTMEGMKNNKLLEVALKKTTEQNSLLKEFLSKNKIKKPTNFPLDKQNLSPKAIINQTMAKFKESFVTQQVHQQENKNITNTYQSDYEKESLNIQLNSEQVMKYKVKNHKYMPYDMQSIDSQDFKIKDFVLDLFERGYSKDKISLKILKFFKLYDLSRDGKIDNLKKKLENQKKNNTRIKQIQAVDLSEKTEIENLFLDCVDECKKEVLKKKTIAAQSNNQSQAKFSNNMIQENTSHFDSQALLQQVVLNKDVLISVFENMFGRGGFVGAATAAANLENQIKNKKYSIISQPNGDNSISYLSNATTKDINQSEEMERFHHIMNAPIESLLNNMSSFTTSQTKIGIRKFSQNDTSCYTNKRASTALPGNKRSQQQYYNSTSCSQRQTALSQYQDMAMFNGAMNSVGGGHVNGYANGNGNAINNTTTMVMPQIDEISHIKANYTNNRANTAYDKKRSGTLIRSRQNQIGVRTSTNDRSFSVKNGKLVINKTAQAL